MILKKPYAFFIKYFKLIHTILLIFMCYLTYRTNLLVNFLQEYMQSDNIIMGKDFTGELFNSFMFALPFIIIAILVALLWVMIYKKKPKLFYVINIVIMVTILVFYNQGYNIINVLETQVLETRKIRLLRDLMSIVLLFQIFGVFATFIRATGFDIKKFDFNKDLEELDITEEDAEEFEVSVEFEENIYIREFKRIIRFMKYAYVENRIIINGLILIGIAIVSSVIYINLTVYNKVYKQGDSFLTNGLFMNVEKSYITNTNFEGEKITDNYLLVIQLNVKANYDKISLNLAKMGIKIGKRKYYPTNKYNSDLKDLGKIYKNEIISKEKFEKQLLIYEIPAKLIEKKMFFYYLDTIEAGKKNMNPKYIKVKLKPYNLDTDKSKKIVNLNDDIEINSNVFSKTSINISKIDIADKFMVEYKYCDKGECIDSKEYVNPILNTNYDKALIKIDGNLIADKNIDNSSISNLYSLIKYYGKIKYKVGRKTKYYFNLNRIMPNKTILDNVYFAEIPKEVMDATEISFIIDARNKEFEYVIKNA